MYVVFIYFSLNLKKFSKILNACDKNKNTALHLASEKGNIECVDMLLECQEISAEVKNKLRWTPMHCAASNSHAL